MKLFRFVIAPLLIVAAFFLVAFRALQPEDPADLVGVLSWLALGPGALFVAGYAFSYLLEKVPGWGTVLPDFARAIIVIVLAVGLAIGARYLLSRMDIVAAIDPLYTLVIGILVAWYGTQKAFAQQKFTGLLQARKKSPA